MIKRTLYFGNPAYLSLKMKQMVVRVGGYSEQEAEEMNAVRTVPIEDIGVVVLDNKQITVTQGLMEALLENNCAVITCDSSHLPVGLFLPLCGNSIQNEKFRSQIDASLPLQKQLWQQTVSAKIANQSAVLDYATNDVHQNMKIWSEEVRSGDVTNLEGRAAAYYWKNIFAAHVDHFVRGREEAEPNNLLNYGYAILRAVIARALVCTGLLPTLGIHHHNRYNAYCLADDIMEPYRPYVDRVVYEIICSSKDWSLSIENKTKLLSIPVIEVNINGNRSPLMVAATTTAASLAKCFDGEIRKILYPQLL